MENGKLPWIVIAICAAMCLLIVVQVNWLNHSRKLIDEQFDQKVTMALCQAIDQADVNGSVEGQHISESCILNAKEDCQLNCMDPSVIDKGKLQENISESLDHFGIDIGFKFDVIPASECSSSPTVYGCSLNPMAADSPSLEVEFNGKEKYVIRQLGLMMGTSIFFLLFIGAVFTLTLIKLYRQRQLYHTSVDLFNNMAHEFRTPLTNISLALKLQKRSKAEKGRYLNIIEEESQRLLQQVEKMLHIARLGEGETAMESQEIKVTNLLQEVSSEMDLPVKEKGGEILLYKNGEEELTISGDPLHIGNAFRNIIDNAIKYTDCPPLLQINIRKIQQRVHLSFKDNGVGISDRQQKEIFGKFIRGDQRKSTTENGFGIGLSYVKQVVELHRGSIQVESEEGKGSIIHLFLPLLQKA